MQTFLSTQIPQTSQSGLMRDLSAGFAQQMFLWGLDAAHPSGNQFVMTGFERLTSAGLQGTSCYRLPWEEGHIQLHGSQAGFQSSSGGVYFVRPLKGCYHWPQETPPVPGIWRQSQAASAVHPPHKAVKELKNFFPFLRWWLKHESHIERELGNSWRLEGINRYRRLPRKKLWLSPQAATQWLSRLLDNPHCCPRASAFA